MSNLDPIEQDKFDRIINWKENNLSASDIIGVDAKNHTETEVKAKFRKLALEFHPDKLPTEDEERGKGAFSVITEAKNFLIGELNNDFLPQNIFYKKKGVDKFKDGLNKGFRNYYNTLFKTYPDTKSLLKDLPALIIIPILTALVATVTTLCAIALLVSAACGFVKNAITKPSPFEIEKTLLGRFYHAKKDLKLAADAFMLTAGVVVLGAAVELLVGIQILCRSISSVFIGAKNMASPIAKPTEEANNDLALVVSK